MCNIHAPWTNSLSSSLSWVPCEGHYYSAPCVLYFIFCHHNEGDLEKEGIEGNPIRILKVAYTMHEFNWKTLALSLDTLSCLAHNLCWHFVLGECIVLHSMHDCLTLILFPYNYINYISAYPHLFWLI